MTRSPALGFNPSAAWHKTMESPSSAANFFDCWRRSDGGRRGEILGNGGERAREGIWIRVEYSCHISVRTSPLGISMPKNCGMVVDGAMRANTMWRQTIEPPTKVSDEAAFLFSAFLCLVPLPPFHHIMIH